MDLSKVLTFTLALVPFLPVMKHPDLGSVHDGGSGHGLQHSAMLDNICTDQIFKSNVLQKIISINCKPIG